jgi:hypothetical protein
MKRKNAGNYFLREVQALDTLLGLAYNVRKKEKGLGRYYPNLRGFYLTF